MVDVLSDLYGALRDSESYSEGDSIEDLKEPWEVLLMEPENSKPIWYRTEEGDLIKTGLMKFLMLTGSDWDAIKRVHPVTDKDKEGQEFANQMRTKQMKRAERRGKPWSWLRKSMSLAGFYVIVKSNKKEDEEKGVHVYPEDLAEHEDELEVIRDFQKKNNYN